MPQAPDSIADGEHAYRAFAGQDAAMDGDDDDSSDEPELDSDPSTRKAFNALRSSYGSTLEFAKALYVEPTLQLRMRNDH